MMLRFGRLDLALKQALIQIALKPLYTVPSDWQLAQRGFKSAVRATVDGFRGNMGRTVKPDDFTSKKVLSQT